MKSKLTFLTLIVLTFYQSSFAQCPANGFTCSVTYTDTNPAPEIIDRQNGGYVCIESGTHNLKGLVINENSGNNGICIGDRAVVTLKAPSSEFKPNGNWSIHGDFIYDSNTTDRFFLTKGPFYISTTGSFTGTNVEFENASDNLNLGANKLIIDGTLTARQLDNHGPATINGSVILESFDSHNKGSQPFIINCSITINPNDASDIVTIADQNIRGTGDFIVNGTLNVPSSNVTFVGDSPTEVLNVVYDNFTGNTNAFGANTTRNAPTGNTTCKTSTVAPIELLSFNVVSKETNQTVQWTVASEIDVLEYTISIINQITGLEESSYVVKATNSFSYNMDIEIPAGKYLAILSVNNLDGSLETYASNFTVERTYTSSNIYPIPAVDFITVDLQLNQDANMHVQIILSSLFGQELIKEDLGIVRSGHYQTVLNVENLASGTYVVQILIDNKLQETRQVTIK